MPDSTRQDLGDNPQGTQRNARHIRHANNTSCSTILQRPDSNMAQSWPKPELVDINPSMQNWSETARVWSTTMGAISPILAELGLDLAGIGQVLPKSATRCRNRPNLVEIGQSLPKSIKCCRSRASLVRFGSPLADVYHCWSKAVHNCSISGQLWPKFLQISAAPDLLHVCSAQ